MIAIIDYKAGNLTSVARAVSFLGYNNRVTGDLEEIKKAERVIFPGVGSAGSAMESLKSSGMVDVLKEAFANGKPVLGICLGTQIILGHSDEHDTQCVGLIPGNVTKFRTDMKDENGDSLKIPHMGWNNIKVVQQHPVLEGIRPEDEFYFVHGYYPAPANDDKIIATTFYGHGFASVIGEKNLIATQFHPEKSGRAGLTLLKNFCEWKPC
jgi:glutamine amidotransferase